MIWFKSTGGLNTKVDAFRLKYDPETGVTDLGIAVNVDYGRSGDITRRLGYARQAEISGVHSLFCDGGECLFVYANALCTLGGDYTYTAIRNVTVDARMSYAQVGDKIYYCNGHEIGYVQNGASFAWARSLETYYPDQTALYIDPPSGTIVRNYIGRMFVAQGDTLWHSEPFGYNLFKASTGYTKFPAEITMVRPVIDGLYIGTVNRTYFCGGGTTEEMSMKQVSTAGVIYNTDTVVDGSSVLDGQLSTEIAAMWLASDGICIGTTGGKMVNLTKSKLDFPFSAQCACLYTGDKYIVSIGEGSGESRLSICLELSGNRISQYDNYNFVSYCDFNGRLLGGKSDGIFLLYDGDLDNLTLIDTRVRFAVTDFGSDKYKRLRRLFFGYQCDGLMKLGVSADGGDLTEVDIVPRNTDLKEHNQAIPIGRDIAGKYFELELFNTHGSDFTLDSINVIRA